MTPFDLLIYRPAEKDFKQLLRDNPDLRTDILDKAFPAIKNNPYTAGRPKKGYLKGVYAYDLKSRNVAYRLCYIIEAKLHTVFIISLGVHDLAYQKAENRVIGARRMLSNKR